MTEEQAIERIARAIERFHYPADPDEEWNGHFFDFDGDAKAAWEEMKAIAREDAVSHKGFVCGPHGCWIERFGAIVGATTREA